MTQEEKKLSEQAIEFFKKKDYDKSKSLYEEILKTNPKISFIYGNLGVIFKIKGDINRAIKCYIEAIKLDPKNIPIYNNLANAFKEIKNYKMYWHLPKLYNKNNFFCQEENIFGNIVSVNMFCIQKDLDIKVIDMVEVLDSSFHPMKR